MGSSSPNRALVYDPFRQQWVKATPEEKVRQHWLQWMVRTQGYPKELIVVEKGIGELPHLAGKAVPERRIDILCYGKEIHPDYPLYPLLMIECKEGPLGEKAIDQLMGYNHFVQAYFIAAVNLREGRFSYYDPKNKKYEFLTSFPSFTELKQCIKLLST